MSCVSNLRSSPQADFSALSKSTARPQGSAPAIEVLRQHQHGAHSSHTESESSSCKRKKPLGRRPSPSPIERISESTPSSARGRRFTKDAKRTNRKIPAAILSLCYSVPETSFRQQDGQHERTAWEAESRCWCPAGFSGCCAVCFAVHFGIQTGSIG
jgi:hypothetical protein